MKCLQRCLQKLLYVGTSKSTCYFGDLVTDVGEQEISAESRENTASVIT